VFDEAFQTLTALTALHIKKPCHFWWHIIVHGGNYICKSLFAEFWESVDQWSGVSTGRTNSIHRCCCECHQGTSNARGLLDPTTTPIHGRGSRPWPVNRPHSIWAQVWLLVQATWGWFGS